VLDFISINPATALATLIGQAIPDGATLLDPAFETPCPPVHARGSSWGRLVMPRRRAGAPAKIASAGISMFLHGRAPD